MSARLKIAALVCAMVFALLADDASAQGVTHPVLHRRGDSGLARPQATATQSGGTSSLTDDASGEYSLGEPGEVIEIILQGKRLDGYISRLGDTDSDFGAPLTFFFDHTAVRDNRISFTTWQVHGVWFSLEGTIDSRKERGSAQDGLYVLTGELIEHNEVQHTRQRSAISLKQSRENGVLRGPVLPQALMAWLPAIQVE
jgi:hypothetical protein